MVSGTCFLETQTTSNFVLAGSYIKYEWEFGMVRKFDEGVDRFI